MVAVRGLEIVKGCGGSPGALSEISELFPDDCLLALLNGGAADSS